MVLIVELIIVLIIAVNLAILLAVVLRRIYMAGKYASLDRERSRYSRISERLASGRSIGGTDLKTAPGSMAWMAVEEALLRAYDSPVADRAAITELFEELGYADFYTDKLNNGTRWEQALAASKLGRVRCEKAVPGLVRALYSKHRDVRNMAVFSLGLIHDKKTLPHLVKRLESAVIDDEEVSVHIVKSSIINFGKEVVGELVHELRDPEWKVRAAILDILAEMNSRATERAVIEALRDPSDEVRAKAAKALGKMKSEPALWPLIERLDDSSWIVRLHATRALGLVRDPVAVESVERKLNDENWQVRKTAAEALGRFAGSAFGILLDVFLNTPDKYAREQAHDELERNLVFISIIDRLTGKGAGKADASGPFCQFRPKQIDEFYRTVSDHAFSEMARTLHKAGRDRVKPVLEEACRGRCSGEIIDKALDRVETLARKRAWAS